MSPHVVTDLVVSPTGCGRSVTDFWDWDAHEARLRCPDEVSGDTWIWSTRRGLNLSSTELPRPWSPWESSISRKNLHCRAGNLTRDLMISSPKLWPLDHEAGHIVHAWTDHCSTSIKPVSNPQELWPWLYRVVRLCYHIDPSLATEIRIK
jgi:hypothetical protein